MKKFFAVLFCAGLLAGFNVRAALPPDLIARIHFVGAGKVAADPNYAAVQYVFSSPEAQALKQQTLAKLSLTPYAWLQTKIAAGSSNGTAQLRPLFDDLTQAEWYFEARNANNATEAVLAVRLDAAHAQVWQDNLKNVLEMWTKLPAEKTADGWLLKKHLPPNFIKFARVGDWVVLGCGQNATPLNDGIIKRIQASKTPVTTAGNYWLSVEADWARLAQWFPALKDYDLPDTQLQLSAADGNVHLNGKFFLAQPLAALETWRVPTNTLHQPFVSLTAARGFAAWLQRQSWAAQYAITPAPNQLFIWALAQLPYQTFAATPVANGADALRQLDARLSTASFFNHQANTMMPFSLELTNNQLSVRGAPFIAPYVRAVKEPSGDFLFGGFFPNTPKPTPLPPDLFKQLATPGLVYYHWEITAERLPQVLNLTQLGLVLTQRRQLDGKSAAAQWIHSMEPKLGNTVTTVTQTAPTELTFSRKAPSGFTAFELIALADWLEAPDFPAFDLKLPPHPRLKPGIKPGGAKPIKLITAPTPAPTPK